jgi:DNA gyrase/topoisomerase IV subunit A
MMTKEEYARCLNKIDEIEVWREKKKKNKDLTFNTRDESYQKDVRRRLAKARTTKEELDAYFVIADNYPNMIQIMKDNSDFHAFAKIMNEKYRLSSKQCKYFQYMSINNFSIKSKERMKAELERVSEHIEFLEEQLEK